MNRSDIEKHINNSEQLNLFSEDTQSDVSDIISLGDYILGDGAVKLAIELNKLKGKAFIDAYLALLPFFKAKVKVGDDTGVTIGDVITPKPTGKKYTLDEIGNA